MFRFKDRRDGKRHCPFYEDLILNPCPICGKIPRIRIEDRSSIGAGCWVTIRCKKWYSTKSHFFVDVGKSTCERALKTAIEDWNKMTEEEWS